MDNKRFTRLHGECRKIINALRLRYEFPRTDCDDMEQEMALALLELDEGTDSYCLARAAWAALEWLRKTYGGRLSVTMSTLPHVRWLIESGHYLRVWC